MVVLVGPVGGAEHECGYFEVGAGRNIHRHEAFRNIVEMLLLHSVDTSLRRSEIDGHEERADRYCELCAGMCFI